MAVTAKAIGDALTYFAAVEPGLLATYEVVRAIWLSVHPSATEADFVAQLIANSSQLVRDSDAILTANGYVRDANGTWSKK